MTDPAIEGGGQSHEDIRAASTALVTRLSAIDTTIPVRFGLDEPELLPDLGASGRDATADAFRAAVVAATASATPDDPETALLSFHAGAELALRDHGDAELQLTAPFAPIGSLRPLFPEWAAHGDADRVARLTARLAQVPATLEAYRARLADALRRGDAAGSVQARAAVRAWRVSAGAGGLFRRAAPPDADTALVSDAERALHRLADWLEDSYLPAVAVDAAGIDRYERAWRRRTATAVSPREAYHWALDRLAELTRDRDALVARWGAGSAGELREQLERGERADLGNRLLPAPELLEHLDDIHRESLTYADAHLAHVRPPLRRLESVIGRPGGSGSAHYQRASGGSSARTVLPPTDSGLWPTWALRSLGHHEGAPGHHLQLGRWLLDTDENGLYRSTIGTIEAVTEGWAMYAETLMRDHGRLDDLSAFGYLDGQILRTARVIVDIGMHAGAELGLRVPGGPDGDHAWTPATAADFLTRLRPGSAAAAEGEVVRYLSWPAQAASYALGEKEWWAARARAQARPGFDERTWHTTVLRAGSLTFAGIDVVGSLA